MSKQATRIRGKSQRAIATRLLVGGGEAEFLEGQPHRRRSLMAMHDSGIISTIWRGDSCRATLTDHGKVLAMSMRGSAGAPTYNGATRSTSMRIPIALLTAIDAAAEIAGCTRTAFVIAALEDRLSDDDD